jgi:hypothetical protein
MPRKHKKQKTSRINLKRIRDYVRLIALEPEASRLIGEELRKHWTVKTNSQEIEKIIDTGWPASSKNHELAAPMNHLSCFGATDRPSLFSLQSTIRYEVV